MRDPNLHLVPVDYDKSLRDDYLPAQLSAEDYPNLVSDSSPIDTIAGEAILASFNWKPDNDRYRRVALLVNTLFSRLSDLQQPPFHPKWAEVAPVAPVAGWARFKAAQEWVDRNVPAVVSEQQQNEASRTPQSSKNPEEASALFRQFLDWKASQPNHGAQPAAQDRRATQSTVEKRRARASPTAH